jgi:hypothetical protein
MFWIDDLPLVAAIVAIIVAGIALVVYFLRGKENLSQKKGPRDHTFNLRITLRRDRGDSRSRKRI